MVEKVLIVDDEPVTLKLAGHVLRNAGIDSDAVLSGREAVSKLVNNHYGVVIADLAMPEMDGFALLEWLRANRPEIVAMVLSATTRIEDVIRALQHGAFDFATKPLSSPEVFVEQVRRALQHKRLQDSNARLLTQIQEKNIELENRLGQLELAHQILQSQAVAIQADLRRARQLQLGLLPHKLPFHERVAMALYYRPAIKVGGDFCDVFALDDRCLGFYMADTAGHGVSSSLITVFLKYSVQRLITENPDLGREPGPLLRALNAFLFEQPFAHDLFISMTYVLFDTKSLEAVYANAGHPPLLVRRTDGKVDHFRAPAQALGINPEVKYGAARFTMHPGDILLTHTDGVTDIENESGLLFGRERLCELLVQAGTNMNAASLAQTIVSDLETFRGKRPFSDDTTLLVFEAMPQAEENIPLILEAETPEAQAQEPVRGLFSAQEANTTYVAVSGTGTWSEAHRLAEIAEEAKARGDRNIVIDFGRCDHLDSTFLGVLHNLCTGAEEPDECPLLVQNLPRPLLTLLSELGLTGVLLHFRSRPRPLPRSMAPVQGTALGGPELSSMVLRAHEALVDADPKNTDRFAAVIRLLQEELERKPVASNEAPPKE